MRTSEYWEKVERRRARGRIVSAMAVVGLSGLLFWAILAAYLVHLAGAP